ncbi:MAG TPA: hypothetical protein VH186_32005 [Chloroflexia bacterium]|nr:hypothetical protein [Chloroflexia bacterium]
MYGNNQMSIFGKFGKIKLGQLSGEDTESLADRRFGERLEQSNFQARPEFQSDLKKRLLESLQEKSVNAYPFPAGVTQPAPEKAPKFRLTRPRPLVLGIELVGALALVLLLVSILSAGLPQDNKADRQQAAVQQTPQQSVPQTALSSATPGSTPVQAPSTSDAGQLYDAASQSYVKLNDAQQEQGFPLRVPSYLPSGFKLDSAETLRPPARGMIRPGDISGYLLHYLAPGSAKETAQEIEIVQWKVPFNLPAATSRQNSAPPATGQVQRANSQTVQGKPAYFIQGKRWSMQFARPPAESGASNGEMNPPAGESRHGMPPAPTSGNRNPRGHFMPSLSIGNAGPGQPGFSLDFGQRGGSTTSKTLVWQQDNILLAVSGSESLSDAELVRVAESLR